MNRCHRCNVNVLDDSVVCPLCNGVLETDKGENKAEQGDMEMYFSHSLMYPDVEPSMRRAKFVIKVFIFLSVVIETILILINYFTYTGLKWSLICGAAFAYMDFSLIYSFRRNKSHRAKMLALALGAMTLVFVIDVALGYRGWSVNYGIPIIIMFMDVNILVLMLVNIHDWQNYILVQFGMLVISLLFAILIIPGIITHPVLAIVAAGVTALLLASTLVFGDKKATTELGRRFRV